MSLNMPSSLLVNAAPHSGQSRWRVSIREALCGGTHPHPKALTMLQLRQHRFLSIDGGTFSNQESFC